MGGGKFAAIRDVRRTDAKNMGIVLRENARKQPEKTAIYKDDHEMSFSKLNDDVNKLAWSINKLGIRPGNIVSICLPQWPEFIVSWFALMELGVIYCPMNIRLSQKEVEFMLSDLEAVAIITTTERYKDVVSRIKDKIPSLKHVIVVDEETIPGTISYHELLNITLSEPLPLVPFQERDVESINFTGGTTGVPKGVEQMFLNLDTVSQNMMDMLAFKEEDRVLVIPPLPHFGYKGIVLPAFRAGASVVLVERFSPTETLKVIEGKRVTAMWGVPTIYVLLLREPYPFEYDVNSLRITASAATVLAGDVMRRFEERFGVPLLDGYGITECTSCVLANYADRPRKSGSCGIPCPGIEVKLVDDNDEEVLAGERGELCIRGDAVTRGYRNRPDAWAEVFKSGYFHTGDIAVKDEDNYFYIVDRKKDMIISGGNNIYPSEIESILVTYPKLADAAVVGIPDEVYGEIVGAFMVVNKGEEVSEEEVIDFCRERLAKYKVPRQVRFIDQIPRSPAGKALRRELREMR
jgi:long-chain acyl-CoA synthetase